MNVLFELETLKLKLQNSLRKKSLNYFTSDWHFGHKGVIIYCNRPFVSKEKLKKAHDVYNNALSHEEGFLKSREVISAEDLNYMNEALVRRWNAQVKPFDVVYILGDFAMSANRAREWGPRLNGVKCLIPGNHDGCYPWPNKKSTKDLDKYKEAGFLVRDKHLVMTLKGKRVLLSHFPYADKAAEKYDTRYFEERPIKGQYNEDFLIHGHCHAKYLKDQGDRIDVGIDNNFKLLTEDDVIKLMVDKRDYIPARCSNVESIHGAS